MSLFKLLIHSFSIIAVFKYQVFLRSTFMIIILAYSNTVIGNFSIFFQILIVLFNLIISVVSLRENKEELKIVTTIWIKLKISHTNKLQIESQIESKRNQNVNICNKL
jgi:hypothetical protein